MTQNEAEYFVSVQRVDKTVYWRDGEHNDEEHKAYRSSLEASILFQHIVANRQKMGATITIENNKETSTAYELIV